MKTMKPFRTSPFLAWVLTLVLAVAGSLTPTVALAQSATPFDPRATVVGVTHTAVSNYVPLLIKYVGSQASATVTVSAGGDITLKHGAASAEVVDTTVECDASIAASGSRSGILDLSTPDAQCDTMGEILDIINDSPNWKAVLLDAQRGSATDNVFITLSETAGATAADGLGLLGDGTVSFFDSIALLPPEQRKMGYYLTYTGSSGAKLRPDPYAGYIPTFFYANVTTTYGSGSSQYDLYCIRVLFDPNTNNETETVAAQSTGFANAATTVLKEHTLFSTWGYQCPRNTKLVARVTNSAAMTAVVHNVYGKLYPVPTR